jgi:hypothetical protein
MGVYNPNAPRVVGQEWVPIREEPIDFAPAINSVERGYSYTLTASRRIRDARFYLNQFPNPVASNQVAMFNTYPLGREALSGPIQQVTIPVSFASITGSGGTNWTIINAPNLASAWLRPDDNSYVQFNRVANVFSNYSLWFDVDKYPQLAGKRILNVSLAYSGSAYDTGAFVISGDGTTIPPPQPLINPDPTTPTTLTTLFRFGSSRTFTQGAYANLGSLAELDPPLPAPFGSTLIATTHTLNLGDANSFFNGALQTDYAPWTYDDLLFFNQGSGVNRFEIQILAQPPFTSFGNGTGATLDIFYFGLRVTFCEEARVMAGGRRFAYFGNTNIVAQRDLAKTADPVLAAGDYTTTLSFISPGDIGLFESIFGNNPKVNGLREISAMPNQPGIEVDIPFPLDDSLGKVFTAETSHVLPQISLHTSGGVLTEIHPYGKQSQGPVYGVNFVTQEVLDGAVGGAASFPQVRFYARRFGNTTVPLTLASPTITGSGTSVFITPAAFDALPEILDGWKQVDLRFSGTVTMGAGTNPQWFWSATGELPGNRWEVLGAYAPAISGGLNNPFNLAAQQLSSATYGQPSSGATINEGWIPQGGPYVTGAGTDDQTADATLIFSQDMPTVTGFSVTQTNQVLTGIGLDCNAYPWYVPSSMSYNRITFSPTSVSVPVSGFGYYELQRMDSLTDWQTIAQLIDPAGASLDVVTDTFDRTVANDWGTSTSGQVWTASGGSASDYNVANGFGTIFPASAGTSREVTIGSVATTDQQNDTLFVAQQVATGDAYNVHLWARRFDSNNYYRLEAILNTSGTINFDFQKIVAGVGTSLGSGSSILTYAAGHVIGMRIEAIGTQLRGKIWNATLTSEPTAWNITVNDSSITAGRQGIRVVRNPANTNSTLVVSFDSFSSDVPGFNDYEARVGLVSSYRIRAVNSLLFAGQWSSTATVTLAAPGVTGTGMGANARTLLFTSNEIQSGASNLAYALAFESDTTEEFKFPEAGFTQFQLMYNRDFQVAFRPLERGGVTFSRTVLVQAAAISPPTLADFTNLRDLAWDDISYVCVRDEDGNRWFANVAVPTGRVKMNNRELYLADISVVEVTDTASVVEV